MNTAPGADTPTATFRPCGKCSGKGRIDAFRHVAGGQCFSCRGTGKVEAPADWREREALRAARRRASETARLATGENEVLWAEFAAAHPVEAARIWELRADPRFGYAYSAVATFRRANSNPADALWLIADAM